MKPIKKIIILSIWLITNFFYPQINNPNTSYTFPLRDLIEYFEKSKGITFSYDAVQLKEQDLIFNMPIGTKEEISLEDFLLTIQEQTMFEVKQKDNNYILYISNKPITISGKIIDLYSRKPLKNIMISDLKNKVYSDSNGNFNINTKVLDTLVIISDKYINKILEVSKLKKKSNRIIEMIEDSEVLDEVLLMEDYITSGINKEPDGSIVIYPKKSKLLPGLIEPNILQSIQTIPGLNSVSENVRDFSTRGSTPDLNLILWEGIKIYTPGLFFDKLDLFNAYTVEKAKIYRSATSASYGGSVGGIIDISSTSEITDKIQGGVGINSTLFNTNLEIPLGKKIGISLAGRYTNNDLITSNKFNSLKDNILNNTELNESLSIYESISNSFTFYDYNSKIIWDLSSKNRLTISSIGNKTQLKSSQKLLDLDEIRVEDVKYYSNGISVNWKSNLSQNISSSFLSQFSNFKYKGMSNFDIISNFRLTGISRENEITDFSTKYNLEYSINKSMRMFSGYEFTFNEFDVSYGNDLINVLNVNDNFITQGAYSEFLFKKRAFMIRAGVRANYYGGDRISWEPRLLSNVNFLNNFNLNVSFERKSQAVRQNLEEPSVSSRSIVDSNSIWWIGITNSFSSESIIPNLVEEIPLLFSDQFTSGVTFRKKGWDIDIEAYFKKNNGIGVINNTAIEEGNFSLFQGKGKIYGIDFLIRRKIGKYRTWLSSSFSKNLIKFPDFRTDYFPSSYNIGKVFNWSHTLDLKNFELGGSFTFQSGAPYSIPSKYIQILPGDTSQNDSFNIQYNEYNNFHLPDYHRLNASLLYSFNWNKKKENKIKMGISVQNILNRKNIISRTYDRIKRNQEEAIEVPFFDEIDDEQNGTIKLFKNDNMGLPFTIDLLFRVNF